MSQIVLGKSGNHNVSIDSKLLMSTRLLITSDSGGGKTWLLKRLIEQAFGNVGIIVIDPEGEFAPLRTKFDFFLVGKGGDTPADIRTAEKVARTLLQGRASAICDIYEVAASERHIWVKRFLDALLDAPKELRHPYFVIVDEAHMFCPEHGKGESEASDAMRGLATRGRKRMLCGIYATQRLATLSKDLTGMCLNRLVGPTFESINQQRAAMELGIPKGSDLNEFFAKVKMLEPGYFYALGRAITKDLELVHIGPIETPHGHEALKYELKPPPPTEKVREWLTKLGDLPKQAEEEAHTVAEFKKQIRELKGKLRSTPMETEVVRLADPKAVGRAVREVEHGFRAYIGQLETRLKSLTRVLAGIATTSANAAKQNIEIKPFAVPKSSGAEIQTKGVHSNPLNPGRESTHPPRSYPRPEEQNGDNALTPKQRGILKAIAQFEAIGRDQISKSWVAARSGSSYTSSAYTNNLGFLRSTGLITYPAPDQVSLTDHGREAIASERIDTPRSSDELLASCLTLLSPKQQAILKALYEAHPSPMDRNELAERSGASANSSAYTNNLGALRSAGMIDYPEPGKAKASDWLFID
ncbi:MAG TPA: type IV secretory system conjugative DNA transfer family protein [Candidatus Acidoferrales bacterium]